MSNGYPGTVGGAFDVSCDLPLIVDGDGNHVLTDVRLWQMESMEASERAEIVALIETRKCGKRAVLPAATVPDDLTKVVERGGFAGADLIVGGGKDRETITDGVIGRGLVSRVGVRSGTRVGWNKYAEGLAGTDA